MIEDDSTPQETSGGDDWEELQQSYEFAIASGKKSRRIAALLYAFALLGGLAAILLMVRGIRASIETTAEKLGQQQQLLENQRNAISRAQEQIDLQKDRVDGQTAALKTALDNLENETRQGFEQTARDTQKLLDAQKKALEAQLRENKKESRQLFGELESVQSDSRKFLESASEEAVELSNRIRELEALRLQQEELLQSTLAEAEKAKRELLSGVFRRLDYPIRPKKKTYVPLLQMYVTGDGLRDLPGAESGSGSFLVERIRILGRDNERLWPQDRDAMDLAAGATVQFQYLGCDVSFRMIYRKEGTFRNEVGTEFTWTASSDETVCEFDEPDRLQS